MTAPPATTGSALVKTATDAAGVAVGSGNLPPELMEISEATVTDPHRAEQLVYADRRRLPNSPYADERDALLVTAINNQGERWGAKAEARRYFRAHPNGRHVDFITKMTGVHPD